jgi:hypothetical protein
MNHTTERRQLAARIDQALQRQLGTGIRVETMIEQETYAREVLFVCEGLEDDELRGLAREYEGMLKRSPRAMPPVLTTAVAAGDAPREWPISATLPAPQDAAWARDTSGFGLTRPAEADSEFAPSGARATPRLRLGSWFRRGR